MLLPFGPFKNEVSIYQSFHLGLCTMATAQPPALPLSPEKKQYLVDPKWKLLIARRAKNINQG